MKKLLLALLLLATIARGQAITLSAVNGPDGVSSIILTNSGNVSIPKLLQAGGIPVTNGTGAGTVINGGLFTGGTANGLSGVTANSLLWRSNGLSEWNAYPQTFLPFGTGTAADNNYVGCGTYELDPSGQVTVYYAGRGSVTLICSATGPSLAHLTKLGPLSITGTSGSWAAGDMTGPRYVPPSVTGTYCHDMLLIIGGTNTGGEVPPLALGYATRATGTSGWVLGSSPLLVGSSATWSATNAWRGDMILSGSTYYLYVNMTTPVAGAKEAIGVFSSNSPFGPFTDAVGSPIITTSTNPASPDYNDVADPCVKQLPNGGWVMGYSESSEYIGLAFASNPVGPWATWAGNPIQIHGLPPTGVYPIRPQWVDLGNDYGMIFDNLAKGLWLAFADVSRMSTIPQIGFNDTSGQNNNAYDIGVILGPYGAYFGGTSGGGGSTTNGGNISGSDGALVSGSAARTMTLRFMLPSLPAANLNQELFAYGTPTSGEGYYMVLVSDTGQGLHLETQNYGTVIANAPENLSLGVWHTFSSVLSSGTVTQYLDGLAISTNAGTFNTVLSGTYQILGGQTPFYESGIQVNNVALTSTEETELSQGEPVTRGLVLQLPLNPYGSSPVVSNAITSNVLSATTGTSAGTVTGGGNLVNFLLNGNVILTASNGTLISGVQSATTSVAGLSFGLTNGALVLSGTVVSSGTSNLISNGTVNVTVSGTGATTLTFTGTTGNVGTITETGTGANAIWTVNGGFAASAASTFRNAAVTGGANNDVSLYPTAYPSSDNGGSGQNVYIGLNTVSYGGFSVAIGSGANASGVSSVAIGASAVLNNNCPYSAIVGYSNYVASVGYNYFIGEANYSAFANSGGIGNGITTTGTNQLWLGGNGVGNYPLVILGGITSSILKTGTGGGIAAAVAGTDYLAPGASVSSGTLVGTGTNSGTVTISGSNTTAAIVMNSGTTTETALTQLGSPPGLIATGSVSTTGTATTSFVVPLGLTMPGTSYQAFVTPTSTIAAAVFYVSAKSTTSFTVTYLAGLTGAVSFDWVAIP